LSKNSIDEKVAANTVVGTFMTTDPDTQDTSFTYELVVGTGDTDNAAFTIVGDQLRINRSPDLKTQSSYSILVQTSDVRGLSYSENFTIDINERPTDIELSKNSIDEKVADNTVVGTFMTTDPDTQDTSFTYQLVQGTGDTDNAAFTIVEDKLRINRSPDFETQSSYSIRVQTTDVRGLSYSENLTIDINDVNEKPTNLINENLHPEIVKHISASVSNDQFNHSIAIDSNGNVWATGSFEGNIDIGGDGNNDLTASARSISDAYIAKFNSNGHSLKLFQIGDNFFKSYARRIAIDSNDNAWAIGSFSGNIDIDGDGEDDFVSNLHDSYVVKFDNNGDFVEAFEVFENSGNRSNEGYSIALDSNDNLWITGAFIGSLDIDGDNKNDLISNGNQRDIYIIKFDKESDFLKAIDIGERNHDFPHDIATDSNDNVWTTGEYRLSIDIDGDGNIDLDNEAVYDAYVVKFDRDGNLLKALNIGSFKYDGGYAIAIDSNDNVWTTGVFSGNIDIDRDGNIDLTTNGKQDAYVVKFDRDGNLLKALNIGGMDDGDWGYAIATDSNDNVWATGSFKGSIDIDKDGNIDLTSDGERDSYVVQFDRDGNLLQAHVISGSADNMGYGIAIYGNDVWVTGIFKGSIDIDGDGNIDLISSDQDKLDSYVVKFSDNFITIDENVVADTVVLTLSTTDPDTGDTFIYELVDGTGDTDNAAFNIVGDELRIKSSPDFEIQSSYSIRIQTTDADGLSYSENLTININDVDDAPMDIKLSKNSINEKVAANTVVGTFMTTDPADTAGTFTYELVQGTGDMDNAAFSIVGDELQINSSPDFETKSSYSIRVQTTDAGGLSYSENFAIDINNVNDPLSLMGQSPTLYEI
ncbi:MAG: hypothetical protein GDA43_20915, partial [Hormoscilla sp. SP5CHS1]|nr:hypothetical protein [Hormoscilla sp. SP5CHS1]